MKFETIKIVHTGNGYRVTIDGEPYYCADMAELKKIKSRPVEVAVEVDEKAVEEAVTAARAKNDAEWAEKLAKANNALSAAELKAEKLKAKIKNND